MQTKWQQFLRRRVVWIPLIFGGLLNVATWFVLLRNISPGTDAELIILHYTLYYGVDLVGSWLDALYIPGFGLLLIVVNLIVAYLLIEKARLVSYFFLILTPIFEFLLFSAVIFLVIANLPGTI